MQEETTEQCPLCKTERVSGDDYCKCGYEFSSPEPEPQPEPIDSVLQTDEQWLNDNKESIGKLIFPDKTKELIDDSQRLVGRADLKKHTNDPMLISRSHFTIYKRNEQYFIKDGITNVQDKPSEHNTFVNDEKLTEDEHKLENNDKIRVSDVEMTFEV